MLNVRSIGLLVLVCILSTSCDEVFEPAMADAEIDTPIVEVVEVKKVPEPGLLFGLGAVALGMFLYKK